MVGCGALGCECLGDDVSCSSRLDLSQRSRLQVPQELRPEWGLLRSQRLVDSLKLRSHRDRVRNGGTVSRNVYLPEISELKNIAPV